MMATNRNRRGSVLLMAIGMLTIVAILASTFLVVSNLDAQETETLSVKAQAEPVAQGAVATIMDLVGKARCAEDSKGPYGASPVNSAAAWKDYMVYPSKEVSPWLAKEYDWTDRIGCHVTDAGGTNGAGCDFLSGQEPIYNVFTNVTADGSEARDNRNYVDADGDGIADALLYNTNVTSTIDANFWMAVRVVDLASRICINTAGDANTNPSTAPPSRTPGWVNLYDFVTRDAYVRLHTRAQGADGEWINGRLGAANDEAEDPPKMLRNYEWYCGRRLLSLPPAEDFPRNRQVKYMPFAIGDEMFLLWCDRYNHTSARYAGRVFDLLSAAPAQYFGFAGPSEQADQVKRHLTTLSSVGAVVRHPKADLTWLQEFDVIDSEADCQPVYERMKKMLEELNIGTNADVRRKMAAHFAANLWAYQANGTAGTPWAFKAPDGGDFTVYGLQQDLVITEAFARHIPTTSDDPNSANWAYGYGVEISNPSKRDINLGSYKLVINGDDGNSISLAPGGTLGKVDRTTIVPNKVVVYSFDSGKAYVNAAAPEKFFMVQDTGGWIEDAKLNFSGGGQVFVELRRVEGPDTGVPVDRVSNIGDELSYSLASTQALMSKGGPAEDAKDIRRDDRLWDTDGQTRLARFNLAVYARMDGACALGKPNEVQENQLNAGGSAQFSAQIWHPREVEVLDSDPVARDDPNAVDSFRLKSIGELTNIYLAGPIRETDGKGYGFPQRVLKIDNSEASRIFQDTPERGRLPVHPGSIQDSCERNGAWGNWAYPDVPTGVMFQEFFSRLHLDDTRAKEAPRVYGQINVNTATRDVLLQLPWPRSDDNILGLGRETVLGGKKGEKFSRHKAVQYILDYRDKRGIYAGNGARATQSGIGGLRADVNNSEAIRGFMTPGEVAIPLGDYMDYLLLMDKSAAQIRKDADYPRARNAIFAYVADSICTRSDVFGVYIHVQHDELIPARYKWHYLAVIDRSCVTGPQDVPALLLFSEVK